MASHGPVCAMSEEIREDRPVTQSTGPPEMRSPWKTRYSTQPYHVTYAPARTRSPPRCA